MPPVSMMLDGEHISVELTGCMLQSTASSGAHMHETCALGSRMDGHGRGLMHMTATWNMKQLACRLLQQHWPLHWGCWLSCSCVRGGQCRGPCSLGGFECHIREAGLLSRPHLFAVAGLAGLRRYHGSIVCKLLSMQSYPVLSPSCNMCTERCRPCMHSE